MCKIIEFQGKTVDSALESASIALRIPKGEIPYEVITYGSTGIFGLIGVRKAAIKVTLDKNYDIQSREKDITEIKDFVDKALETNKNVSDDTLEIGKDVLKRIIKAITDDAKIEVSKQNRQIIFNIKGGASGIIIGKKGQTLEAIQYIVEKIVNKNSNKRIKILIDVENYLKKKRENLQRLSCKLINKVRRTKKPVTVGQLNAFDRRIVHTYLKDEYDIRTQSIGSGYYRKLMIFPQKQKNKKTL